MAEKKIARSRTRAKARPLPLATRANKPEKLASTPVELTHREMVHIAIDGVDAVRRALCNVHVALVRKNTDAAAVEHVLVLEELERVYRQLVQLDLTLPEGGAS